MRMWHVATKQRGNLVPKKQYPTALLLLPRQTPWGWHPQVVTGEQPAKSSWLQRANAVVSIAYRMAQMVRWLGGSVPDAGWFF